MGKRRWTTPEQRAWLEALVPAFVHAQQQKATGTFFEDTYKRWYKKWPTALPTTEEIREAKGNTERALASQRKTLENRIKFWFHNNTRGSSSGAGTRGMLKLSVPSKTMQPWQAYLNKFQNTTLKEKIDNAWQQYLSKVPEGQKPEKMLFEIRNKLAQELYKAETAEVKQEVKEYRKTMVVNREAPGLVERNKSFQRYISLELLERIKLTFFGEKFNQ
ncbi:hypothetical protein F5888DRAFT_1624159 [Russula emetica]|nr:hypothetical protein F5888DRAFT_1624159 [Russula emetica]